jgi:hypothetical protein
MTIKRAGCQWCEFADDCGVLNSGSAGPEHCPIASLEHGGREPTVRDVIVLLTALQTGINQRFAQVMLLINRHEHNPNGRPP